MHDPFPAPPTFLVNLATPLATHLSLHKLPPHIHEIFFSFLLYHTLNKSISPRLSTYFFPTTYPRLRPRTQVSWDAHVVSLVQSCIIITLAVMVMVLDHERWEMGPKERLWGYTGASGMVQSFATGYFVWDLWTGIWDFDVHGWGVVIHAVCALAVSMLGYRPFVNYYGVNFVLYELSTPFLNIHWFMDKCNKTGSRAQWINGVALLSTFAGSRLLWGTYQSLRLYQDIWLALRTTNPDELPVPPWLALLYLTSIMSLSVLNVHWFGKMIESIMSRFEKPKNKNEKNGDLVVS